MGRVCVDVVVVEIENNELFLIFSADSTTCVPADALSLHHGG